MGGRAGCRAFESVNRILRPPPKDPERCGDGDPGRRQVLTLTTELHVV
jgi:hypothetical protein